MNIHKTDIEWCSHTWNPVTGCKHGCEYCYARWLGSWGAASVTKYLVSEEHIFFFDDEDVEAVLIEVKGYDEFLSMTDKEAQEAYNALPWVECIAVDINLP